MLETRMNTATEPVFRKASFHIPPTMQAWVLGDPDQLSLTEKPVPQPGPAEVLVRIDAIAVCATDLEIIHRGPPAMIQGGLPFNKNFTPGHEYMGTVELSKRGTGHASCLKSPLTAATKVVALTASETL
jgi:NADPH:quinone reductase-like Zn-dependent oxidoreductase